MKKDFYLHGYVTITILILMTVLLAITYIFADALFSELAIARNNKASQAALSLAEAGVQEAIYRVQYDATAKNNFLYTAAGTTTFTHSPALLPNSSYTVTIQNTAKGVATINAVGNYTLGLRTARREIQQIIAQATTPQYTQNAAMYTISTNCDGCSSTGDITLKGTTVKIYNGGLMSGKSLNISQSSAVNIEGNVSYNNDTDSSFTIDHTSTLNFDCFIDADPDPEEPPPLCSEPEASHLPGEVAAGQMPMIDFDSASAGSYKNQAIAQNQYFSRSTDFINHYFPVGTTAASATGIVYVDDSLEISSGRTFTINGVLATSGTLNIGKPNEAGAIVIQNPGGNAPSGILMQGSLNLNSKGNLSGTGLVWVGEGGTADFSASASPVVLTGAILARKISITNRDLTIHFDSSLINNTIGNPDDTPVLEINHWEEEY